MHESKQSLTDGKMLGKHVWCVSNNGKPLNRPTQMLGNCQDHFVLIVDVAMVLNKDNEWHLRMLKGCI